ncbi:MAG: tRNA pseudouridine(38-40) synthase TruA [Terriglobales bacterium]
MRNLKIVLAYDGYEFAGWQVQPGLATIQGTLATAIGRITGEKVLPQGSGRTDAGVHALRQVATFSLESPIPAENLVSALNDMLPPSIRALEADEVSSDFHARKSAKSKTYCYRMYREPVCPPFLARYVWHYPYPLEEGFMKQAAALVIGEHDFTSFAAVDPERMRDRDAAESDKRHESGLQTEESPRGNVRRILDSAWERQGTELVYSIRASGFLHHMVRNLVGTFLLVGKGTLKIGDVTRILQARKRSAAGATAPSNGLFLVEVEY